MLNRNEKIVLDLRPHWWVILPASLLLGVAVIFGLVVWIKDWHQIVKILSGLLILGALGFFLNKYVRWTAENFVVTSQRVISRRGVMAKEGMEIPLDRINTVMFKQSVFERVLGAGDLSVESAGEGGQQTFNGIRKPALVQQEIYRQMEGAEARDFEQMGAATAAAISQTQQQPPAAAAQPAQTIPEQIEKLDQLRQQGLLTDQEFEEKKRQLLDRL